MTRVRAVQVGVTIFSADIIYHLFDMFIEYRHCHRRLSQPIT